jgi:hypothetical protein
LLSGFGVLLAETLATCPHNCGHVGSPVARGQRSLEN